MAKLTSSEYVEAGGAICPVCESNDIEGGPVEIDIGVAQQYCTCLNCDASWRDLYDLTGYDDLEEGGDDGEGN